MSIAHIWEKAMVVYLKLKRQSLLGSEEGRWGLCVKVNLFPLYSHNALSNISTVVARTK